MINSIMNLPIIPVAAVTVEPTGSIGYVIGAIIALLILSYLVYSIARPEKF